MRQAEHRNKSGRKESVLESRAHMANWDSFDRMEKIAKTQPQEAEGQRIRRERWEQSTQASTPGPVTQRCPSGIPTTHLSTDSTNTLRAFMWIQAIKASLKFTLSQRSRGPCRDGRTT